jgi:hypothetical protein
MGKAQTTRQMIESLERRVAALEARVDPVTPARSTMRSEPEIQRVIAQVQPRWDAINEFFRLEQVASRGEAAVVKNQADYQALRERLSAFLKERGIDPL